MHIVALHLTHTAALATGALKENEHTSTLIILTLGDKGGLKNIRFFLLLLKLAHRSIVVDLEAKWHRRFGCLGHIRDVEKGWDKQWG